MRKELVRHICDFQTCGKQLETDRSGTRETVELRNAGWARVSVDNTHVVLCRDHAEAIKQFMPQPMVAEECA